MHLRNVENGGKEAGARTSFVVYGTIGLVLLTRQSSTSCPCLPTQPATALYLYHYYIPEASEKKARGKA